jgi:hypothetical protein
MTSELYRPIEHAEIRSVKDVPRETAIRLYCTQSYEGGRWSLQVRAPETLANGREGMKFIIACASLDRDAMAALRDAIETQLAEGS